MVAHIDREYPLPGLCGEYGLDKPINRIQKKLGILFLRSVLRS